MSYLIQENAVPDPISPFPAAHIMPYSAEYSSFNEEMIARATHVHATYPTDNEALYQIISTSLADTPFMTSVKRHRAAKDGRGAYLDLVIHHSGSAKWNDLAAESDRRATTLVWNGRSHRYTLAVHINNLRSCHNDMLRAVGHTQYAVPTETQRVERLLKSLQTNEPAIISGITTIRGSTDPVDGLYTDFEQAADFLLRIAPKQKQGGRDHNVSGLQQDYDNIEKVVSKGPKTGVELRYYTRKDFQKLSKDEKAELLALRVDDREESKDSKNNGKKRKSSNRSLRKDNKKMRKYTKELEARISALESKKEDDEEEEEEESNPLEKPTQRGKRRK